MYELDLIRKEEEGKKGKLTASEGTYVDAAALTIVRTMLEKEQVQFNIARVKEATIQAYDMALAMLEARKEKLEVDEYPDWKINYIATSELPNVEEEVEEEVEVEPKEKKAKKKDKKKDKRKEKKAKKEKKNPKKTTAESEYNIKPLLEAAEKVVSD